MKDGSEFSDAEDGKEFLAALTAYQCAPSRDRQLRALLDGFWSLVKPDALLSFSEAEVKKLIGGISVFDGCAIVPLCGPRRVADSFNSEFFSDTKASSTSPNELDQQIESFWKVVQSWSIENQRALMRYVTGLQDMPATHRLKILKASDDKIGRLTVLPGDGVDALPPYADKSEHVLFLPSYDSVETMEAQVLKIINNENLVRSVRSMFGADVDDLCRTMILLPPSTKICPPSEIWTNSRSFLRLDANRQEIYVVEYIMQDGSWSSIFNKSTERNELGCCN